MFAFFKSKEVFRPWILDRIGVDPWAVLLSKVALARVFNLGKGRKKHLYKAVFISAFSESKIFTLLENTSARELEAHGPQMWVPLLRPWTHALLEPTCWSTQCFSSVILFPGDGAQVSALCRLHLHHKRHMNKVAIECIDHWMVSEAKQRRGREKQCRCG